MSVLPFTDEQNSAIHTTGRTTIVSAAAGSGKTAVLAERCAYLVCDAPQDVRCEADELLVLTFTEAAAAEMRTRIVAAIRRRSDQSPHDERLREQMTRVDAGHISTIHAFCLWIVRRWFQEARVDATVSVSDAREAELLRHDVLETVFSDLYAMERNTDVPLGRVEVAGDMSPNQSPGSFVGASQKDRSDTPLSARFVDLVDRYGLGKDRSIAEFVLKLSEFLASQTNPETWLADAQAAYTSKANDVLFDHARDLALELDRQLDHVTRLVHALNKDHQVAHYYGLQLQAYVDLLTGWRETLGPMGGADSVETQLDCFEQTRQAMEAHEFPRLAGPRLAKDAPEDVRRIRERAHRILSEVKTKLFVDRLKKRFALFSVDECMRDLRATGQYVTTLVELTLRFQNAYARRKRELNVVDFSDQERLAYDLLRGADDPSGRSAIARELQNRFAHVLVDEFQDINPLQQAIISLVSRTSDARIENNLFVVGDVKQSIYRFRLAEPEIFVDRLARAKDATTSGHAILLRRNFRSRPEILEAVNFLFDRLMQKGIGDIVYDQDARLQPGRVVSARPRIPVEIHLLEKRIEQVDVDDADEKSGREEESGVHGELDPSRWTSMQREARAIGLRIQELIRSNNFTQDGRPLEYRDFVVLLRAKKFNAEHIAGMLSSMGIPAHADLGGSLLAVREIRDILAALKILDNVQQDIPLAGVLRSGVLGERLTEDELVQIRMLNRHEPFHAVVRKYGETGKNKKLRNRVSGLLATIARYRTMARRRPLPELLGQLYDEFGYFAYASALPNGDQRRANLYRLYELAARFGTLQRQGLHRFLLFVEASADRPTGIPAASALSESENVVRIQSIHQAKGLEFPVVFVAGLGNRFNLGDRIGRMIFERTTHIGLKRIDPEKMVEYPTVAHRRVAAEVERTTRAEELRVLYVAMTRACDKLILVGSCGDVNGVQKRLCGGVVSEPPSDLEINSATTPLDWLIPAWASAAKGAVMTSRAAIDKQTLFSLSTYPAEVVSAWRVSTKGDAAAESVRWAIAEGEALPADEPLAEDDSCVQEVMARLDYTYRYSSATSVRASLAASEAKRPFDYLSDSESQTYQPGKTVPREKPAGTALPSDDAKRRGIYTHRVLEHLDFSRAVNREGVAAELDRLIGSGVLTDEDIAFVDQASLEWFVQTPLADRIRCAGDAYRREFMFLASEPLTVLDATVDVPPEDRILVRGIVDGVWPVEDGVEIVDFKTDAITADVVPDRARSYQYQMATYARAVARLWRSPVRKVWLVFLSPQICHELETIA